MSHNVYGVLKKVGFKGLENSTSWSSCLCEVAQIEISEDFGTIKNKGLFFLLKHS